MDMTKSNLLVLVIAINPILTVIGQTQMNFHQFATITVTTLLLIVGEQAKEIFMYWIMKRT